MQTKNSLDRETIKKIVKGAAIAGGGAAAIYILEAAPSIDFGQATALVTALASVIINAIREYQKGR